MTSKNRLPESEILTVRNSLARAFGYAAAHYIEILDTLAQWSEPDLEGSLWAVASDERLVARFDSLPAKKLPDVRRALCAAGCLEVDEEPPGYRFRLVYEEIEGFVKSGRRNVLADVLTTVRGGTTHAGSRASHAPDSRVRESGVRASAPAPSTLRESLTVCVVCNLEDSLCSCKQELLNTHTHTQSPVVESQASRRANPTKISQAEWDRLCEVHSEALMMNAWRYTELHKPEVCDNASRTRGFLLSLIERKIVVPTRATAEPAEPKPAAPVPPPKAAPTGKAPPGYVELREKEDEKTIESVRSIRESLATQFPKEKPGRKPAQESTTQNLAGQIDHAAPVLTDALNRVIEPLAG